MMRYMGKNVVVEISLVKGGKFQLFASWVIFHAFVFVCLPDLGSITLKSNYLLTITLEFVQLNYNYQYMAFEQSN